MKYKILYKKIKPFNNSSRHKKLLIKNNLSKNNHLIKSLYTFFKKRNGRDYINGNITSWHRGAGVKKLFRNVNYFNKINYRNAIIINTNYDPYRTAHINLNFDILNKKFFYNVAAFNSYPGTLIKEGEKIDEPKVGFRAKMKNLPIGSIIHNITLDSTKYTKYIRSAGTYGILLKTDQEKAMIKLPSKKIIEINNNNYATLGQVSNLGNNTIVLGKAGTNRLKGKRPHVRGIAMNPVDHPHGGRSNGGIPSVTPWGLPTKCKFKLKRRKHKK